MKLLIVIASLIVAPLCGASNFDVLEGVYDAHSTDLPIKSIITVKKDGDPMRGVISFKMLKTPFGQKLNCSGPSVVNVEKNQLETVSHCKSGLEFEHILKLDGISNFDDFTTKVRNTLWGGEYITMYVKRRK